jgi:predicted dehydrogenase
MGAVAGHGDVREPARVGIVGLGAISAVYLETLFRLDALRLVAVADLDRGRASSVATSQGVRALSVEDLVTDPTVDIVLNLTTPAAHEQIALQAIAAGKAVYGEKPLAATTSGARRILEAAAQSGTTIGCAPDTVLGTGFQTARKAIDDGLVGTPTSATAIMMTPGHERWHPNPDFYYQPGGGPLLDMGPYYVTALIHLLGPVASVLGASRRTAATRTIGTGTRAGEQVPVDVDTHVTGILRHVSGVLTTLTMSFDTVSTQSAPIEVHGDAGSLLVPDPNRFDGEVRLCTRPKTPWEMLPVGAGYRDAARGYGLADLVVSSAAEPRAGGRVAFHVLDILESLLLAAGTGRTVEVASRCERPPPVPLGDAPGGLRS